MKTYPKEENAIAWLQNHKEYALSTVLKPWIKAGLSIDKCMDGLRALEWPEDEIPSRSALGRRLKMLRQNLGIKKRAGRPCKEESKSQKTNEDSVQIEKAKVKVEDIGTLSSSRGGSNAAPMRPGFESIEDVLKQGAGKYPYSID